jgi:DNA-binding beta-propeller fold protein YncE
VLVIDDRQGSPTRHQVITEVKTGGVTRSVEVHENGRMVYVADTGEKSLIAIDRRSHEVVDTIALTSGTNTAGEHDGIAIDESSHRVYIAHQFPDIISVVQTVN